MKQIKFFLLLPALLLATALFAQYPAGQIAFGDGTSTLVSDASLKYGGAQLSITSVGDNYLSMFNGSGSAHLQFDADGNLTWWTPLNQTRKMRLLSDGQLRMGLYAMGTNSVQSPRMYDIVTTGGIKANDQILIEKVLTGSSAVNGNYYSSSGNAYHLQGTTAGVAYHTTQSNLFQVLPSVSMQQQTITGYQSGAQANEVEVNYQNYTDQGPGQIWAVQTNSFHPIHSNLSKFVNTYVRTHLEYENAIGTYYSMYLEAPFGPGNVSQITNYYGVYQESAAAKNFFAGKLWLGTIPTGSVNSDAQLAVTGKVWIGAAPSGTTANSSDAQLAVNGNVYCSRLKVLQNGWADYVFAPGYQLPTLAEVEGYIKAHGHLPGVVSAKEVEEKGNDVGENQKVLLQKVEELTLYMIDMKKQMEQQDKKIADLEALNKELQKKASHH